MQLFMIWKVRKQVIRHLNEMYITLAAINLDSPCRTLSVWGPVRTHKNYGLNALNYLSFVFLHGYPSFSLPL